MSPSIEIDAAEVLDWDSFHSVFARKLGFPPLYGKNLDAWIDCVSALDAPEEGLSSLCLERGEVLTIILHEAHMLKARAPQILEALSECAAFVNWRRLEQGEPTIVALAFYA